MKTLILGTCYISAAGEGAQNYGGQVVRLWLDLAAKLNPGADILLVDSRSPVELSAVLGLPRDDINGVVHVFEDNIGHLNTTGADGWGRAFCWGVEYAIEHGYEFLAYIDADIIFTRPIAPIIEGMDRKGIYAAMPPAQNYAFAENGMMFLDVEYLRQSKFVEHYDWPNRTRTSDPAEIPEMVCERLFGDELFLLPIRAFRDTGGVLTVNNVEHAFPYGCDALTHVRDFRVYQKFVAMKGIESGPGREGANDELD